MQGHNSSESIAFSNVLNEEIAQTDDYLTELSALLHANKYTVSVIESITGGGIARKFVETPGCSAYFLGGAVAYHPRLKIQYGQVLPKTISEHGVVSAMVTEQMATGIKKLTQSDISIASNGIAGPKNDAYSADQSGTLFLSWNIRDKIKKQSDLSLKGDEIM